MAAISFSYLIYLFITVVKINGVPNGSPVSSKMQIGEGNIKEFPFMARIVYQKRSIAFFPATILSEEYVMTAASYLDRQSFVTVHLGGFYNENGFNYNVSENHFYIHPNSSGVMDPTDIALVKIPKTNFTDFIRPIRLPSQHSLAIRKADIIGWNMQYTNRMLQIFEDSYKVKKIEGCDVESDLCKGPFYERIPSTKICVSKSNYSRLTGGRWFGNLFKTTNSLEPIQIGIFSDALPSFNGEGFLFIFTKVSSGLDWIKNITGLP